MSAARDAIEKATGSSKTAPTDINLSEPNTPEQTPNIPAWPLSTRPICNTIADLSHLTSTANKPITASQANGVTEKLTKKTYCVGTIRIENESKSRRQIDKGNSMLPTNSTNISEHKAPRWVQLDT